MKNNAKIILILVPIILVVSIAAGITGNLDFILNKSKITIAEDMEKCNNVDTALRFSCFRNAIEENYDGKLSNLIDWVESNSHISYENKGSGYAIFGTNCHTFYHALGDYVATKGADKQLTTLVDYGAPTCTSGYMMGLYKRTALNRKFDLDVLENFYPLCPEPSKHSCAHEIGHILNDKYVYSILKPIDEISDEEYNLEYSTDYQYTTFENPDLKSPFDKCQQLVPEEELSYCYTGVGHNVFIFSEFSPGGYKDLLADCESMAGEQKNNCYDFFIYRIGINDVATKFMSQQYSKGKEICDTVVSLSSRPEAMEDCYIGLGGGIGLFLESEFANVEITEKNIRSVQERVLRYINLCKKAPKGQQRNCYKGILGTGVKNLYKSLNINHSVIEEVLPQAQDGFEVVG